MTDRPSSLPRAARLACRVLQARHVTELPVRPLEILKACRNTTVLTYAQAAETLSLPPEDLNRLLEGADAVTFSQPLLGEMHYIVIYRPDGHPARLRFTIAHELGHRLLGHHSRTPQEEQEADLFASHLLCPQPVIARLRRRYTPLTAETVAAVCYVSRTCARMLARREPLEPHPLLDAVDALLAPAADAANPAIAQNLQHPLRNMPE